jgi:lysophospholipase L1-like esterase/Flp pilus assembly pilin Flp
MHTTDTGGPRRRGQRGATTTEYALVLAGIAAAATLAFALLSPSIAGLFERVGCLAGIGCEGRRTERAVDPWDSPDPLVRATWGGVAVLGDSFSSGEGAGDYGVAATTLGCHASGSGYGVGLTKHLGLDRTRLTIRACTGARLSAITGGYDDHHQAPQLDGIDQSTSLVTMTIGGNDLNWGPTLADCIVQTIAVRRSTCRPGTEVADEMDARLAAVGPELSSTLGAVARRAPFARVVVMGYPRFFPDQPTRTMKVSALPGFTVESQRWANDQTDRLNQAIAQAAASAGVEYVDAGGAFAGHELTTDEPWFHGVELRPGSREVDIGPLAIDLPVPRPEASTFHPTATGQQALGDLVEAQVRQPARVRR